MNPWGLNATGLLVWGVVAHLLSDWVLQNDYLARNKGARRRRFEVKRHVEHPSRWWDRHPALYVHVAITAAIAAVVLGWLSIPVALVHGWIDTRWPVNAWQRLIRQTRPARAPTFTAATASMNITSTWGAFKPLDIGLLVFMAVDQVFHVLTLAAAALVAA